jgi:uncharacterized membrane protein/glutaredoxin
MITAMAKKRKQKQNEQSGTQTPGSQLAANWPVFGLAVAGMLLTAYLSYSKWQAARLPFCDAGSGCDDIQASRWSVFLGLPMAFWGFLTYVVLAVAALRLHHGHSGWRLAWLAAIVGWFISIYLTIVGLLVLDAACPYCMTSLALLTVIIAVLWWQQPKTPRQNSWLVGGAGIALASVLLLHLHFSGIFDAAAGPEDPYLRDLAEHLTESGAQFYGAYWCPHCQEQKELFGASAKRLPYVECTPDGRNKPRADACIDQQITSYPTWIIRGERHTRVLTPDSLANYSGYSPTP